MRSSGGNGGLNTRADNSYQNQYLPPSFASLFGENNQDINNSYTTSTVIPETTTFFGRRTTTERMNKQDASHVPKFKSFSPATLPLSPAAPVSPSSYLVFSPSLSPSGLLDLDSHLLFGNSTAIPSPTTGALFSLLPKEEERDFSDFSFRSQTTTSMSPSTTYGASSPIHSSQTERSWAINKPNTLTETTHNLSHRYDNQSQPQDSQPPAPAPAPAPHYLREQKRSEDGYNWRKYGQKQVKGSENPRSYYKCTYPNCPTKKKMERNVEGHITEIVYKGNHIHPKPQSFKRSSSQSIENSVYPAKSNLVSAHFISTTYTFSEENFQKSSVLKQENSNASFGDDDCDQISDSKDDDDDDENEPHAKRWKGENENERISASAVKREPRIVVQTTSDIDILDDGYRWRKYGQKVVKSNLNPRSYYKCTFIGCPVRKHVERASHDLRAVITTYEGKHNHDVPAARGSSNYAITRPLTMNTNKNLMQTDLISFPSDSIRNRIPSTENQDPYTLQMLQNSRTYEQMNNTLIHMAKEEPKDNEYLTFSQLEHL